MVRDARIEYFMITNLTGEKVSINVKIERANKQVSISPLNLQLAVGESYTDKSLQILEREIIVLYSSAPVDYYFSIV